MQNLNKSAPRPPLPTLSDGRGVEPPAKFAKGRGGLEDLNFEIFKGFPNLQKKTKKTLNYLMTKKVYKQKYFSLS